MNQNPQLKIHLAQINTSVGDLEGNCKKILTEFKKAERGGCDLVVFCEMTLTGYPCEDLWKKKYFLREVDEKIQEIVVATKGCKCAILLGSTTISLNSSKKEIILNSALLIENGSINKIIVKKTIPNHGVFDEKRYFEEANSLSFVEFRGLTLSVMICEDVWDAKNLFMLQEQVFDVLIVINSSPYTIKKHLHRDKISQNFSKTLSKPFIYVNQVGGQDSLVFDGGSFALDDAGKTVTNLAEFAEDFSEVELKKNGQKTAIISTKSPLKISSECARNYSACVLGLRDYIKKNHFTKVLLGMSGGIDSALVAAIAVDALGSENVALYALPSRYNSSQSMSDAEECAKNLEVKLQVISIESAFEVMKKTINFGDEGLAIENLQARIRGNILMALSNFSGALLLSTGNKSELAVGYATIYGDMCGAFNPIKDLYKTQVFELAKWRNDNVPAIALCQKLNLIPQNILTKAPSAELRPNQKDSDSLPDYEILDKILFGLVEEDKSISELVESGFDKDLVVMISKLLRNSEYKRRQAVIGPKISEMSFDKDRRYPVTNNFSE